jgi:hypothetical protein
MEPPKREQSREVLTDRLPQHVEVDVEVVVNKPVPHPGRALHGTAGWAARVCGSGVGYPGF